MRRTYGFSCFVHSFMLMNSIINPNSILFWLYAFAQSCSGTEMPHSRRGPMRRVPEDNWPPLPWNLRWRKAIPSNSELPSTNKVPAKSGILTFDFFWVADAVSTWPSLLPVYFAFVRLIISTLKLSHLRTCNLGILMRLILALNSSFVGLSSVAAASSRSRSI